MESFVGEELMSDESIEQLAERVWGTPIDRFLFQTGILNVTREDFIEKEEIENCWHI